MKRRRIICANCDQPRAHEGRGLCATCRSRMETAGRLDEFPPIVAGRAADIAELHERRIPIREIADRLGVCPRTVWRHLARLRNEQEGAA